MAKIKTLVLVTGAKSQVPQHGDRAALALRDRTCPSTGDN